jgi:hypothetical protein
MTTHKQQALLPRMATDTDVTVMSWYALVREARQWQSDLDFYAEELSFMKHLAEKYLLVERSKLEQAASRSRKLTLLNKRRLALALRLNAHLAHMSGFLMNPFTHDWRKIKDEHGGTGRSFKKFTDALGKVKRQRSDRRMTGVPVEIL